MGKKTQWIKYVRGPIFLQRHFPCLKGDFEVYPKYFRVPFGKQIYYGNSKVLEWYLEKKFAYKVGGTLIGDLAKNNWYAKIFRKNWAENYEKARETGNQIIWQTDLEKLSNNSLKKLYQKWFYVSENFNGLANVSIDATDEVLLDEIRTESKKIVKNSLLLEEAWRILTTPTETTYIQKRDLEAIEIARRFEKEKKRIYNREIENLVRRYWWSTLGWMADKKYLEPEAKKEISNFLRDKNLEEKYWQFKNFSKMTENAKKKELEKIRATKKLKILLRVFEEIAILKDQRKEGQVYLVAANKKILEEIARRKKQLKYEDIVWLTDTELLDYLDGKKGLKKISDKRKKHTIIVVTRKEIFVREGKDALKLRKKLFPEKKQKKIKEFKGLPASRGYAKGRVLISLSSDYANKHLKQGQILVTAQTTPDFVPAMRRAGAIITDEGGVTSHAAIISRELNIPCIVDAKIAMQVLKTGDEIEVDATKGIVKIIKRK